MAGAAGQAQPNAGRKRTKQPDGRRIAVQYRPLRDLVPYARNARTHTPTQLDKLRSSLGRFGWTNPMLIAGKTMLAGHARLAAAIAMAEHGEPIAGNADPWSGPTVDLSHLSAAERRAYVIADNRIALDAGWDMELLRAEFEGLKLDGLDLALTGFDLGQIGDILKGAFGQAPDGFAEYGDDIETEHECPRCGYVWSGGKARPKTDEAA
jgi:ParB-like chromosome segregation protein Spo0J